MTLREIIRRGLIAHGYGGLVRPDIPCGCTVKSLFECGETCHNCVPGHKHTVDPAENDGAEWLIYAGTCGPHCGFMQAEHFTEVVGARDLVGLD